METVTHASQSTVEFTSCKHTVQYTPGTPKKKSSKQQASDRVQSMFHCGMHGWYTTDAFQPPTRTCQANLVRTSSHLVFNKPSLPYRQYVMCLHHNLIPLLTVCIVYPSSAYSSHVKWHVKGKEKHTHTEGMGLLPSTLLIQSQSQSQAHVTNAALSCMASVFGDKISMSATPIINPSLQQTVPLPSFRSCFLKPNPSFPTPISAPLLSSYWHRSR